MCIDSNGIHRKAYHQSRIGFSLDIPVHMIVDAQDRIMILDNYNLKVRLICGKTLKNNEDVIRFDEQYYSVDGVQNLDYPNRFWQDTQRGNLYVKVSVWPNC